MLRTERPTRPRSIDDLLSAELVLRLSQVDIASRKMFAGKLKGERKSKKRGESVEFADYRSYVVGDDLRHIDWNIYGRLDRLFLKLFLEEEDLSLHLVIDASASLDCGDPSKFLFCQRAAAALAYVGLVNFNRVSLSVLGGAERARNDSTEPDQSNGKVRTLPGDGLPMKTLRNLRGRRRTREMGDWLCSFIPEGTSEFADHARRLALTRQGKGVMVVLSDFLFKEGYEQGLRYLIGRGYDVVAIQVLSPQEIKPTLGGDLRLKDIEDGDAAEVTITAPLLKRYKQNLNAYCDGLSEYCTRREITHLLVQSNLPIDTLILEYLRKRGVLR